MKSRVDIFRPLAAATRSCRPASATSIFRRNDKCGGHRSSDDDDSFVVSVPQGDWPPHKDTLGSAASDTTSSAGGRLKASVPLPTGTTASSGGEDCKTGSSPGSSPLGSSRRTTAVKVAPPPSYYKIELDPENDQLQLMAGDDASVQFTPEDHNQQLQVAGAGHELSESLRRLSNNNGIVRASPIARDSPTKDSPSKERHGRHQSQQRWTISGEGEIVAIPPSPSQVSMTHSKPSSHPGYGLDGEDISIPPMLVKADSSSTSSSASTRSGHPLLADDFVREEGAEVISLESPPRMTRSVLYPKSLFQDSVSSRSSSPSTAEVTCGRRMARAASASCGGRRSRASNASDGAEKQARRGCGNGGCGNGGCGTKSLDLFGMVLDMFSLSGPCCRQEEGDGAAPVPVDAVVCR